MSVLINEIEATITDLVFQAKRGGTEFTHEVCGIASVRTTITRPDPELPWIKGGGNVSNMVKFELDTEALISLVRMFNKLGFRFTLPPWFVTELASLQNPSLQGEHGTMILPGGEVVPVTNWKLNLEAGEVADREEKT